MHDNSRTVPWEVAGLRAEKPSGPCGGPCVPTEKVHCSSSRRCLWGNHRAAPGSLLSQACTVESTTGRHVPTSGKVDNVRCLSRQAHCHGRAIRIRLSHQAEVASVVVDNNLERGQRAAVVTRNRYRWLRDSAPISSSTSTMMPEALTAVRKPAVRAAAVTWASPSLCVEHSLAARGPAELHEAMKDVSLRRRFPRTPCERNSRRRLRRAWILVSACLAKYSARCSSSTVHAGCHRLLCPSSWTSKHVTSSLPCNARRSLCLRILVCVAALAARAMVCLRHKVLFPSGLHEQPRSRRFPSSEQSTTSANGIPQVRW